MEEHSPTKKADGDVEMALGPLDQVGAFVDVRTAEGDDSSAIFVLMLKDLGAKVRSLHLVQLRS